MEQSHQQRERTFLILTLGVLFGIVAFCFLCWGGYRYYSNFESRRMARRGAAFLSGGDLRQAGLAARRGLQLKPDSLQNLRLLAEIGEKSNDNGALKYRRQALEANPDSGEDARAMVKCALQFNDLAMAEKVLADMASKSSETVFYFDAAAQVAEEKKEIATAEDYLTKAVRLAPNDLSYQLHLALIQLRIDDPAKRAAGEATLQRLRADEKQRMPATRALIVDGLAHHRDPETLAQWARELQDYPGAQLSDCLLYAGILRMLQHPDFAQYLTQLEARVGSKTSDVAALISWMRVNDLSLVALDYARSLSPELVKKSPVAASLAAACVNVADWPKLKEFASGNWDQNEFLRRAYLARALRAEGNPEGAQKEWAAAEKIANGSVDALNLLLRMATEWGWNEESTNLLWTLSKQPESQLEALHRLNDIYTKARDTADLHRVLARLVELQPNDERVLNNFAQISLLLHADIDHAFKIARELYQKDRSNAAYASTYAYALFTTGDKRGALTVMKSLPEIQLQDPSIAAYYGIVLAGVGNHDAAQTYLTIGASGKLLPEEERLIAAAQDSVR